MTGKDGVIPSTLISQILLDFVNTMHQLKHPDADFQMTMKRGFEITMSRDYNSLKSIDHYLLDNDVIHFVTNHWLEELVSGDFFTIPDILHQYFDPRRPIEEVQKLFEQIDLQNIKDMNDEDEEDDEHSDEE